MGHDDYEERFLAVMYRRYEHVRRVCGKFEKRFGRPINERVANKVIKEQGLEVLSRPGAFDKQQRRYIIALNSECNKNAAEAKRRFEQKYGETISAPAVKFIWRGHGLKVASPGGAREYKGRRFSIDVGLERKRNLSTRKH